MLKSYKIYTCTNGALGLHLSRAPWDPYPWVSSIQKDSNSYQAGLRIGDCLLELNGQDVLGMKISEIAALLRSHWLNESSNYVTVVIWRNRCSNSNSSSSSSTTKNNENSATSGCNERFSGEDGAEDDEDEENNAHNINQQSLQKFATCLQHIAQLLECPVCLEVIKPPGWQCCNGHVLCNNCRSRSEKCPVCRVPLGPRGRCLLSDKLFTLLADSFPCDGVRSNKSSPKDRRRKCSMEFHDRPKLATVQKLLQDKDEQYGTKKAKDFLVTSLGHRTRKLSNSKRNDDCSDVEGERHAGEATEDTKYPSMQKQAVLDTNKAAVVGTGVKRYGSNRKSTPDYTSEAASAPQQHHDAANAKEAAATTTSFRCYELQEQTSTIQQCHCIPCSESDRVAAVNNTATSAATMADAPPNKCILRIPGQGQLEHTVQREEKYKSYQCPTGKLCCLNVNVMSHAECSSGIEVASTCTNTTATANGCNKTTNNLLFRPPATNNNLSTTTTSAEATEQKSCKFRKSLKNEWDILAHLTEDHLLPVNQYYGEYGQRILVQSLGQQHSIACLNLKAADENDTKAEKFFIACIPLEILSTKTASRVAIFMYHMNALATSTNASTALRDEASGFESIIENPLTGIKWFGRAHPLTTPWSHIHEEQHFLPHNLLQRHFDADASATRRRGADDAFVIVVKRKS